MALVSLKQAVLSAFTPDRAMGDPFLFAGRASQLEELLQALHTPGSCPIIYGHRGLGKTSTAIQLDRIARGDVELLERNGLAEDWTLDQDSYFLTVNLSCTDAIVDLKMLLRSMTNALLDIEVLSDPSTGRSRLVERSTQTQLNFKVFSTLSNAKYEPENLFSEYQDLNAEERVVKIARHLSDVTGQPVLFIIDEVDRLNTAGLAAFIKANTSAQFRVLLVGIGMTLSELMNDHRSIERIAMPVKVDRMSPKELRMIVANAVAKLQDDGYNIDITDDASIRLSQSAYGFPWFVHLLGQSAFLAAAGDGATLVTGVHVDRAITGLSTNRFGQQFSDLYQKAVRDSPRREALLRGLAHWRDDDVPTGDVYRMLAPFGYGQLSQYLGHLKQPDYGGVLSTPIRSRGLVRFNNEMFKTYCRIRTSLYGGLDEKVAACFE